MPALPNVPKVLRVVQTGLIGSDLNVINRTFHQYSGSAPTNADLNTFCGLLNTNWVAHMQPLVTAEYSLENWTAEDLTSPTAAVGSHAGAGSGTRASSADLPAGACALMKKTVARRYRGGKPRSYLFAGAADDLASGNRWSGAFIVSLVAAYQAFQSANSASVWAGGGTLNEVNVSFYEGFLPHQFPNGRWRNIPTLRGTPLIDVIQTYTAEAAVASQRRRNARGA